MEMLDELAESLESRFNSYIDAEIRGDVSLLYEFIDPLIRERRELKYDIEPAHTIDELREFVNKIDVAEIRSFAITKYVDDGGPSREHRPTTLVLSKIRYNKTAVSEFQTPWVFHQTLWYTTSLGKSPAFDRSSAG